MSNWSNFFADLFLLGALVLSGWLLNDLRGSNILHRDAVVGVDKSVAEEERVDKNLPLMAMIADKAVVEIEGETPGKRIVGTGFFISSSGLVLTNRHVMEDPLAVYSIVSADGVRHRVERVVMSREADLALVETDAVGTPWLGLGESDSVEGQKVALLNNGPIRAASFGEVDGYKMSLLTDGNTIERDVIQINARVHPGDSGSPLLDSRGRVVGIVFAYDYSRSDVGFAIPVNKAKELIEAYTTETKSG